MELIHFVFSVKNIAQLFSQSDGLQADRIPARIDSLFQTREYETGAARQRQALPLILSPGLHLDLKHSLADSIGRTAGNNLSAIHGDKTEAVLFIFFRSFKIGAEIAAPFLLKRRLVQSLINSF